MTSYITEEDKIEARINNPVRFGPIGEKVFLRTYSRKKRDGTPEDWIDTCARVVNGNCNYVGPQYIEKGEAKKLFELFVGMQAIPAGRHLWATNIGNNTGFLNNCFAADHTPNFSDHFHFTFMRLMEGGGVGSNYSDRFINSRDGTPSEEGKPWKAAGKKHLHIVCSPSHKDFNRAVSLDLYEEQFFSNYYWMDNDTINLYEKLWEELRQAPREEDRSKIVTYFKNSMTGEPDEDRPTRPYVDFKDLLSIDYSHEWSPGVSNGEGPVNIVVEDSREGWAGCLRTILDCFIHDSTERDIVVDVSRVRAYGEELKGFGGKASGPEALMLMLHRIFRLMNQRVAIPLSSLDIMLLDHYIAMAVVSGGVRRSARMSMKYWKDPQILEFIKCKYVEHGKVPCHWTTNISVVIDNRFLRALKKNDPHAVRVYEAVVEAMLTNGEPGFINASLCCEGEAPEVIFFSTNPCGEITMVRYGDMYCFDVCCLGHVNLSRVQHPEEAFRLMSRFLLRATFAPVVDENQKRNVERNRRIGVGFFGYHNWLAKNGIKYSDAPNNEEVRKFFRRMKKVVDEASTQYAHDLRIPAPVKKTTIAPTGSISTIPGDCSAAQCNFAKVLIRRVRYANTDSELAKKRAEGYEVEPDMYAANTSVVSFVQVDPIYDEVRFLKEKELLAQGLSKKEAYEQSMEWASEILEDQTELAIEEVLATQKMLQKEYVDNSISFTINVNPALQAPDFVKHTLRHYLPDLKGVTIFPEWSMPQSPLERISFEEFKAFEDRGYPIERSQVEMSCANGVCPIK